WNFNSGSLARLPTIVTIGSPLIAVLLGCSLAAPALRRPLHVEVAKPRRAHQSGVPAHGLDLPAQVAQRGHEPLADVLGGPVGHVGRDVHPLAGVGLDLLGHRPPVVARTLVVPARPPRGRVGAACHLPLVSSSARSRNVLSVSLYRLAFASAVSRRTFSSASASSSAASREALPPPRSSLICSKRTSESDWGTSTTWLSTSTSPASTRFAMIFSASESANWLSVSVE